MTALATARPTAQRPLRLRPAHRPARALRAVTHEARTVDPPLPQLRLISLEPIATEEAPSEAVDQLPSEAAHLRTLEGPSASPGRVCASILQVAGEAMRGLRPLAQLTRWVDAEIFAELARFAPTHGERTSVPQRLDPDATAAVLARAQVRRIRVSRIAPGIAECTALVEVGSRVRAVVMRLEGRGQTWRATALQSL